ncbi:MAG: hypothetical protein KC503_33295 [Myxococcales bacterium]|nr:hypothetical protein [Myxococcales bacterium]
MYRDHDAAARIRLDEVAASHSISPDVERVYARRVARIWAGSGALFAAAALVGSFLVHLLVDVLPMLSYRVWHDKLALTLVGALAAAWVLAPLLYLVGRVLAPALLRRAVRQRLAQLHADSTPLEELARREHDAVNAIAAQRAARLERASLTLPLAAVALLAPLSLHAPIALLAFRCGPEAFGDWINLSYRIVGHAHLVLMLLGVHFARRLADGLARGDGAEAQESRPGATAGWHALAWTTLAGALPGVVFLAVPPILVFITGIVFVPASFRLAANASRREAQLLRAPR